MIFFRAQHNPLFPPTALCSALVLSLPFARTPYGIARSRGPRFPCYIQLPLDFHPPTVSPLRLVLTGCPVLDPIGIPIHSTDQQTLGFRQAQQSGRSTALFDRRVK